MTYPVNKLISKAYYLSGIVSRQSQSVTGDQFTDGLELLNEILSEKSVKSRLVPFFKEYEFDTIIGTEKYNIPGLILAETLTFDIDNVRYATREISRINYFGTNSVEDIKSLPFTWHLERVKGGADIYLHFTPDKIYPIKIWGKFGLDSVVLGDDLFDAYELSYLKYLRFELAGAICEDYNIPLSAAAQRSLDSLRISTRDISPKDLSIKYYVSSDSCAIDYPRINLGGGWCP